MAIAPITVTIPTADGLMPAYWCPPPPAAPRPGVLLLMEAFGLTSHIREVARRIAQQGYGVLAPDLYYREPGTHTFGYDQVATAMATMGRLDFGQPVERDLEAAIAFLKAAPGIAPDRLGVTGFCLGGGLSFLAACRFSAAIAAAAPFYGMVLDEWIEAVSDITVPVALFFGGQDPFIGRDRIQQIEARFAALGKAYSLTVYPEADHGFFCHERASYNAAAAADSWERLMQFFRHHL
ncbi:dienelactone hydrolase family protein [Nodosilinea sp. PGN35]|uniref:dienelactone hydrolase family protein n=1 Tax=Nodosilinea sp. PGN35 TaxID=3020489 RepID=UPI0023B27C31|nr:dienelactone hydrolase family protein [Nodosilinea sp. TSF1-S3]MDF0367274.1 dienelactone hydrolase family protein [Nodosilinea sp. TSF1-S3]